MSDTELRDLARKLKVIREPTMRRVVALEFLRANTPDAVIDALHALITRRSDSAYFAIIDAVTDALGDVRGLDYQRRADLYAAAHANHRSTIARLLFTRAPSSHRDTNLQDGERAVIPRGRELTLGERKALARTPRRQLLVHLTREPHPDVIEILLANPHVTEREVLSIAARRPTTPECLLAVARDARWRARYAVRCALALNPHVPLDLALRLSVTLRDADLGRVRDAPDLDETLRLQARELLAGSLRVTS